MTHAVGPQAAFLADGRRLHLQHGPIDLVIEAQGRPEEITASYRQARTAFEPVLTDLVDELPRLRRPATGDSLPPSGPIARAMWRAVLPHAENAYVTPMAAVAGAVADHISQTMTADRDLRRAYVNNGGDIALFLAPGQRFTVAVCSNPTSGQWASSVQVRGEDHIGGIATSGWRGRSHSLGIADAVTALASSAAVADAAATLIANAVDLPGSSKIQRTPAREMDPDSDLGDRPVTVGVEKLGDDEVRKALQSGQNAAQRMQQEGLIVAAFLSLQGAFRTVEGKAFISKRMPPPKATNRALILSD